MAFLVRKDPAKFKAIIAAFITGPFMVAVGTALEILDIIGDHVFYQDVYGGWIWDTDAVPPYHSTPPKQGRQNDRRLPKTIR